MFGVCYTCHPEKVPQNISNIMILIEGDVAMEIGPIII